MKLNKLKSAFQGLAAVFGFTVLVMSCNSNDESANNSTTAANENVADTTAATADKPAKKPVRKGKVSGSIEADNPSVKVEKGDMGYYNRTDVAPAYEGGQSALENYIVNNLEYPQDAIDNDVEGTVRIRFAVDPNGNVTNVSAIGNRIGYGLEDEAVRVVSAMPKWTAGEVKGKKVTTWRTLPIYYKLES